jgi:phage terminase large subunit-like protein
MSKQLNTAEQYIEDILSGEILCGKYERLAVERHLNDLKYGIDRGLYFDHKAAVKAMRWFNFLRHSKGKKHVGKAFELAPWQAFIVYSLFGWMRSDGTRRFRKAYISVAKKNGKTTFAAGIATYMMKPDNEPRAEVYSCATRYAQARICFDELKSMVRNSPGMPELFTVFQNSVFDELSGSFFQPLSSDSQRQDGINPHFAIVDEYHAHPDNGLVDNIQSAMGSRTQPMMMMITTAGFNKFSPCYDEELTCKKILEGILDQDDKFSLIFCLDEGDNWEDPTIWRKANPNMDISVDVTFLKNEYTDAMNNSRKVVNFQTKNLNMWVDSATGWIRHNDWKECNYGIDITKLEGKSCFGGLDLAAHEDFNTLTLIFDDEETGYTDVLMFAWLPESRIEEKRDRVDYRSWVRQGWITTTPGNVIDIEQQVSDMLGIIKRFDVKSIGFDPHRAYHGVVQALQAEDVKLNEFRQRTVEFDAPTREIEKMVLSRKLNHGGNPLLAWMVSNVEIMEDTSGNIKPSKGRSREKIDGVISLVMALGERMTFGNTNYINFST